MNGQSDTLAGHTMNTLLAGRRSVPTTRWTRVAAAADPAAQASPAALASLRESYWRPLYAYVRRRGYSVDEAQDLTQEFFVRFILRWDMNNPFKSPNYGLPDSTFNLQNLGSLGRIGTATRGGSRTREPRSRTTCWCSVWSGSGPDNRAAPVFGANA